MSAPPPDLDDAYALSGPEDNRRLYAAWAATYDRDFAAARGYLLPEAVAAAFAAAGGRGPVLDLGAGTGLVGAALAARGIGPLDGADLSPEMLAVARGRGVYRALVAGDVLAGLPLAEGTYAGVVSAGTFTLGHLGPEALPEAVRLLAPGGLAALSVNARHFAAAGFAPALAALADRIEAPETSEVPIYAPGAGGDHAGDTAFIVLFRRRPADAGRAGGGVTPAAGGGSGPGPAAGPG